MEDRNAHKNTIASASVRREFFVLSVFLAIPAEPNPLFIKRCRLLPVTHFIKLALFLSTIKKAKTSVAFVSAFFVE